MCSKKDDDLVLIPVKQLDAYVNKNNNLKKDILIACAASELDANEDFGISVYYYPIPGSFDVKIFESASAAIDPADYTQYMLSTRESSALFNGYLRRFELPRDIQEKWIILTYLSEGKFHISDPILLKHVTKPTLYNPEIITVDQQESGQPHFSWENDTDGQTVIYFEVLSDSTDHLISGTYTYEKHWQYYNLENVVLNITQQQPPASLPGQSNYTFTLMGVSEDNWVNLIGIKSFVENK